MTIKLYNNESETNKIGKSLLNEFIMTGTLRDECDLMHPVVRVTDITPDPMDIYFKNYMYIQEFNRYYFIEKIEVLRQGLWQITGRVDVLETFKEHILNQTAVIKRQASIYNLYLTDEKFKTYQFERVQTKVFADMFQKDLSILLVTAGG